MKTTNNNNPDIIRLLVIEDNATLVKAGLRSFFRPGRDLVQVSEVVTSVAGAIEKTGPDLFDVILLDLIIPGATPKENMRELKKKFPSKPVVIYTSLDSKLWRRTMWNLGASGYVHKNDSRELLKNAIMDAYSGKASYHEDILATEPQYQVTEFSAPKLSVIEKELLSMLVEGRKYKEISLILSIKVENIESVIRQLRLNFGAKSTPQLIYLLSEKGLL
jgi:DNA-binding NarL/FixJ family response regulator